MARNFRGLTNFIGDIRQCTTNLEEKELIDEEVIKIENAFKNDNIGSYYNMKYIWKILYISLLGYDVPEIQSIVFERCLKLVQSSIFAEVSVSYSGIVLFSSFPIYTQTILTNKIFIETLKKHLLLPINAEKK
eukprot:168359_1